MSKRKAIIESLPKHRFEEVLKNAGFRASKYLHESDSGLSGTPHSEREQLPAS